MIAAAYADGQLDAEERRAIVDRLEAAGLDDDDRAPPVPAVPALGPNVCGSEF